MMRANRLRGLSKVLRAGVNGVSPELVPCHDWLRAKGLVHFDSARQRLFRTGKANAAMLKAAEEYRRHNMYDIVTIEGVWSRRDALRARTLNVFDGYVTVVMQVKVQVRNLVLDTPTPTTAMMTEWIMKQEEFELANSFDPYYVESVEGMVKR